MLGPAQMEEPVWGCLLALEDGGGALLRWGYNLSFLAWPWLVTGVRCRLWRRKTTRGLPGSKWKVEGAGSCLGSGEEGPTWSQDPQEALLEGPRDFPKPETRDLVQKSRQPQLCYRD